QVAAVAQRSPRISTYTADRVPAVAAVSSEEAEGRTLALPPARNTAAGLAVPPIRVARQCMAAAAAAQEATLPQAMPPGWTVAVAVLTPVPAAAAAAAAALERTTARPVPAVLASTVAQAAAAA